MSTATEYGNSSRNDGIAQRRLPTPAQLKRARPAPRAAERFVAASRRRVANILRRRDHRLLVIVGPCSIHDPAAARHYARQLKPLADETGDVLLVVMRAYFEKPRTTLGWKGLINDPHLDASFDIERGLLLARELLLHFAAQGVPVASEALDPCIPQYLHDLVTWAAIGARTAASQTHREMASGLGAVVGFKNSTDGTPTAAINAMRFAASPQRFLGMDQHGKVARTETPGNPHTHIVLRGGDAGPNYAADAVARCEDALAAAGLPVNIMVDCSHANSAKRHERQAAVAEAVADQIAAGNRSIVGLMAESNLAPGKQPFAPLRGLTYGVSITDACMGWDATAALLRSLATRLRSPLRSRLAPLGVNGSRRSPSSCDR